MQGPTQLIFAEEPAPPGDRRRGLADAKKRDKKRHDGAEVVPRALVAARLLEGRDARNIVCQKEAEDLGPRRGPHAHAVVVDLNWVANGGGLAGEEREGGGEVGQKAEQKKHGRGGCSPERQTERRRQPPARLHLGG